MIFINYNDIYEEYTNEENELDYRVVVKNATIPIHIDKDHIMTVEPLVSQRGSLYKNVSLLKDRNDKIYKVVGNYKDILNRKNERVRIKGFR